MDSILTSIKKLLGVTEDYEHFDSDIIMHINTVLMILNQVGIGSSNGFMIMDKTATWDDFISKEHIAKLAGVKSYVYLKVKLVFDPPSSSHVAQSMKEIINELEWRLHVEADNQGVEIQNG